MLALLGAHHIFHVSGLRVNVNFKTLSRLIKKVHLFVYELYRYQNARYNDNKNFHFVFEHGVLFVSVDLHVSLCGQQHPKCEQGCPCVIAGFRREVDEKCALLGHYAVSRG